MNRLLYSKELKANNIDYEVKFCNGLCKKRIKVADWCKIFDDVYGKIVRNCISETMRVIFQKHRREISQSERTHIYEKIRKNLYFEIKSIGNQWKSRKRNNQLKGKWRKFLSDMSPDGKRNGLFRIIESKADLYLRSELWKEYL